MKIMVITIADENTYALLDVLRVAEQECEIDFPFSVQVMDEEEYETKKPNS